MLKVQSNHKVQSSKFKVNKRKKEAKANTNLPGFLLFHLYKREPLYQGSVLIYVIRASLEKKRPRITSLLSSRSRCLPVHR